MNTDIDTMTIDQLRDLVRDIQLALDCAETGDALVDAARDAAFERDINRNRDFHTRR